MQQVEVDRGARRQRLGNILVATDFSAGAAPAVARAALLPITPGSAITLLHVLPGDGEAGAEAAAQRTLDQAAVAARAATQAAGQTDVDVFTSIAHGTPFVEIIRGARDIRAQLIVLGRHGRRTFRALLLGSTAERVLRKGDTPVLVVTSQATGPYQRPLVAVDGSDTSRRAVELALRVVGPGVIPLEVVHAYEVHHAGALRRTGLPDQESRAYRLQTKHAARALVDAFLATCGDDGRAARVALRRGDPRHVIRRVAAQRRADLLALGTHGRSGLAHLLIGSVAEAVVRTVPCDVLVARPVHFAFALP